MPKEAPVSMSWIFQVSAAERSAGRLSQRSTASVVQALGEHGAVLLRGVYTTNFIDALKHDFDTQWGAFSSDEMRGYPPPTPCCKSEKGATSFSLG